MKIDRSKEWRLARIDREGDHVIGAGVPDRQYRQVGRIGRAILRLRAKMGFIWRIGLIKRTTAFRWEMDAALGEWSIIP